MDGMNADFAGAKICPAADTCQSSYRTCLLCIKNREVIYDRILRRMFARVEVLFVDVLQVMFLNPVTQGFPGCVQ